MHPPRLGVVVALDAEARALYPGPVSHDTVLAIDTRMLLRISGMGWVRAAAAAHQLIAAGADGLVSWGTAGALERSLRPGDLLLPEEVLWKRQEWPVHAHWREALAQSLPMPVHGGGILSVVTPCATAQAKSTIRLEYASAQGVDMESGAIAAVAHAAGKPFVVLRSIVDPAAQSLPVSATGGVDAYGRPQVMALLRGLLRHPVELRDLLRLGGQMRTALKTLQAAAPALGVGMSV